MKRTILVLGMTLVLCYAKVFGEMPEKVFAPYVDVMLWPTFDIMTAYESTGQKYFTLAFVIAGTSGQPTWGGAYNMDYGHMQDQISELRNVGGDVIISFGGASGTPIASTITNTDDLVTAYETVINTYNVTWIDFDIEGWWVQDDASIDNRNAAAAILQSKHPDLRITYCLPVMPTGLTSDGLEIIQKAISAGVNIYGVNVMAMDYGQSNQAMGSAAISAAESTHTQTGLNIGITPMIGQNDTQNEIFSLNNASEVLSFAQSTSWVNMLAMWSVNRDNGDCAGTTTASPTCSGLSQNDFQFTSIFYPYSGTTDNDDSEEPETLIINAGGSYSGEINTSITFQATVSGGTSPYTFSWDFGDGSTGSDNYPTHTYTTAGTYTITLTVTDSDNATTISTATATIEETDNGDNNSGTGCWTTWTAGAYVGGSQVSYNGVNYQAKWWTNGTPSVDTTWENMGTCDGSSSDDEDSTSDCWTTWTAGAYVGGSQVSYNGVNYQAKWWTDGVPGEDDVWENMGTCSAYGTETGNITDNENQEANDETEDSSDSETDDSSDSDNGQTGVTRTGEMTYYGQESGEINDVPGNAGGYTSDDLQSYTGVDFCAMQTSDLMSENLMGGCVEITSPSGNKTKCLIVDKLPTGNSGDIDLYGKETFAKLEDPDLGRVDIQWKIVALPTDENIQYRFQTGSNAWWAALQIFKHKYPLSKVEYKNESGEYIEMVRQSDGGNFFIASGMGDGPFTIRLTDYFGNIIIHDGIVLQSTYRQDAGSNLKNTKSHTIESPELDSKTSFKCYPNPADNYTVASFTLLEEKEVKITFYNLSGEQIKVLKQGIFTKGTHKITLDTSTLSSGMYLLNFDIEGKIHTLKLIIK